ncbi:Regulator of G-protein signaling 9 [Dissostichus eleginoides]|uniref:Regulator of G-protein signaling 9 n=1 Tax=Dissostichus eleginoides TaxID=100907 RepID=A0AAD9BA31_DISEL|nr:Regulator of G-protein signaling 9 [Dissostichus eleginoides]
MTIRTARPDRVQHFRPRMHCLKKLEAVVVEMQSGVKGSEQKLNVTTIPHVIIGKDIIAWITNKMKTTTEESEAFGTMLVAYGYIYPLQNHRKLVMCNDSSLYRFQTPYFWPTQKWVAEHSDYAIYLAKRNIRKKGMLEPYEQAHYNHLHEWLNHKWDFIVMQATEQYKYVNHPTERAYWIVNKPPRRTHSAMDSGLELLIDPNSDEKIPFDVYRRMNLFYQQAIMRSKVKSSVSLGALNKYVTTYKNHDPFLAPCLPSNPWLTDNDTYWTLNMRQVEVPTKMRVERWSFSLFELLSDLRGRDDFKIFLKKEFSGMGTFLAPGAPRWINIDGRTMGLTVKGLDHPHRYVLEAAQTHVFLLMKKDTFFRYLKSPVYKEIEKKALNPEPHNFSPAQLEQNAQNRSPGIHPLILWQQDEAEKAKAAAASAPVDVKALMSKLDRKK